MKVGPTKKQNLKVGEALVLAVPFVSLLSFYGFATGYIRFVQWPPSVEMTAAFGIPTFFCLVVYLYVLVNLHEWRKGDWKWYREGFISAAILLILWSMLWPVFDRSVWLSERSKVNLIRR